MKSLLLSVLPVLCISSVVFAEPRTGVESAPPPSAEWTEQHHAIKSAKVMMPLAKERMEMLLVKILGPQSRPQVSLSFTGPDLNPTYRCDVSISQVKGTYTATDTDADRACASASEAPLKELVKEGKVKTYPR